uniref:Uncharacterized protein n=1 Tax=Candidatus Nitrotoga fabula TaxID=2182327 RepID=A0A2X0RGE5_9PROT|nr:protein of unknown function [Candidatus Nitrotoga fabula]
MVGIAFDSITGAGELRVSSFRVGVLLHAVRTNAANSIHPVCIFIFLAPC